MSISYLEGVFVAHFVGLSMKMEVSVELAGGRL